MVDPIPHRGRSGPGANVQVVAVNSDIDIVTVRQKGRALSSQLGFSSTDLTVIATAISELARNILLYGCRGEIRLEIIQDGYKRGVQITATDIGPGIPDIELAMQIGYSTSKSLGLGLPGVRRLMDEMEIQSEPGKGTTVKVRKWKRVPSFT